MPKRSPREFTYAETGVDRALRAKSKRVLAVLDKTYVFSRFGSLVRLPYGNIFPVGGELYLDLVIEVVGTKVLIAQLADKYDTIGIDGVAMAVNDVIRSGAQPLAIADNISAQASDPVLVREWIKGIVKGADEAECLVAGGEIGDMPDVIKSLVKGKGFDMVIASIGEVHHERIIYANKLEPGDAVIGLRSSGIHSNGISLARKVLFKQWGGKYEPFDVPEGFDRELVHEVLEPTKIYVKPFLKLVNNPGIKAAVHITGDAYQKFDRLMRFNTSIGFEFDNFKPQPIFSLVKAVAKQQKRPISDEEMFRTFNMGWGFAVIVPNASKIEAMESLRRSGIETSQIGKVTGAGGIVVKYNGKKIALI